MTLWLVYPLGIDNYCGGGKHQVMVISIALREAKRDLQLFCLLFFVENKIQEQIFILNYFS